MPLRNELNVQEIGYRSRFLTSIWWSASSGLIREIWEETVTDFIAMEIFSMASIKQNYLSESEGTFLHILTRNLFFVTSCVCFGCNRVGMVLRYVLRYVLCWSRFMVRYFNTVFMVMLTVWSRKSKRFWSSYALEYVRFSTVVQSIRIRV